MTKALYRLAFQTFLAVSTLTTIACDQKAHQNSTLNTPSVQENTAKSSEARNTETPSQPQPLTEVNNADSTAIRQSLEKLLSQSNGQNSPPATIKAIYKTPVDGLFAVYLGGKNLFYVHKDGRYLLQGSFVDLQEKKDIGSFWLQELSKINFKDIPVDKALTWSKDAAKKHEIVVFADPNCGYCKRFEKSFQEINGLTVHTFVIPILSEDSHAKSIDILCASKPIDTWRSWMLKNQDIPKNTDTACAERAEKTINHHRELAKKYGVESTPHIILPSGYSVAGALPSEELLSLLESKLPPQH